MLTLLISAYLPLVYSWILNTFPTDHEMVIYPHGFLSILGKWNLTRELTIQIEICTVEAYLPVGFVLT